jgi:muramidase (phage lysozyme)
MAVITEAEAGGRNVRAFLDMIAHAEGTAGLGDDGYNVIVGGGLFSDYADHPRMLIELPKLGIKSTAAGRYQFLSRTWDVLVAQCGLRNFSPLAQDRAAVRMFRWANALDEIQAGKVSAAIVLCRKLWASLPNAGYGQREHKLEKLTAVYASNGGVVS